MSFISPYVDRLSLGPDPQGRPQYRDVIGLRPVAYLSGGSYLAINNNFVDSGDGTWPHLVTAAPLMISSGPEGQRRIHPTKEPGVYMEVGRLWHQPSTWQQAPMNALTRNGNVLTSVNTNYDLRITMYGHGLKFELQRKGSFWPNNSTIAFPASLVGLNRVGSNLFKNGTLVAKLRPPIVLDANDKTKTLPVGISFGAFGGNNGVIFALPTTAQLTTAGITTPVMDPTLDLQPDASTGLDAYLDSSLPTTNTGTSTILAVGQLSSIKYRTLIKFPLTDLPDNAVISAATYSRRVNADSATITGTWGIYRLKRAWVETQATWNEYSTGNSWTAAGGFDTADCEQTTIGELAFTASEAVGFKDISLTPTTKAALDLGNGWMDRVVTESNDNEYNCDSSDHATAANRPKLSITYTVPSGGNSSRLFLLARGRRR